MCASLAEAQHVRGCEAIVNPNLDSRKNIIQLKQLKSLYSVIESISSKLHFENVLESVPQAVKAITGSTEMAVALVHKTADGFEIDRETMRHTCSHPSDIVSKADRWRVAITAIKTNKPIIALASGELVPYDQTSDHPIEDIVFAIVPLTAQNKSIGFISVIAPERKRFDHKDIVLLTILASHIVIAIENARLHLRVQELSLAKERCRIAKEILAVVMQSDMYDNILPVFTGRRGEELTNKEREVLTLMAKGYTNEEIAKELWIGLKTVKTHVSSIIRKWEQKNRVQAIVCALQRGLIEFTPE